MQDRTPPLHVADTESKTNDEVSNASDRHDAWGNGHVGRMLIVGSQHFTERQSGGLQCACF